MSAFTAESFLNHPKRENLKFKRSQFPETEFMGRK